MTESERIKLIKDAPALVEYGIKRGWIQRPSKGGQTFVQQMRRREEFYKNLSERQATEAEAWEVKRPRPDQYNDTTAGYRAYRAAYKDWCRKRARAIGKVTT